MRCREAFCILLLLTLLYTSTVVAKNVNNNIIINKNLGTSTEIFIEKTASLENRSIVIDNGIILIDFGENWSGYGVWYYKGGSNLFYEEPFFSYGNNTPVGLSVGTIYVYYPDIGNPDIWYDAVIGLDLDGDGVDDINVTRSVMVPSNAKYFLARYCIKNVGDLNLENFRVFQGADYDAGDGGVIDEGGYDIAGDFVWTYDLDDGFGTYVGFKGNLTSVHHDVDNFLLMWGDVSDGTLNDATYYRGDVGVALEWNLGTLNSSETKCLTVKFAFADDYYELRSMFGLRSVPVLSPFGVLALIGAFAGVAILSMRRN